MLVPILPNVLPSQRPVLPNPRVAKSFPSGYSTISTPTIYLAPEMAWEIYRVVKEAAFWQMNKINSEVSDVQAATKS